MKLTVLLSLCICTLTLRAQDNLALNFEYDSESPHIVLILSDELMGNSQDMAKEVSKYNARYFEEKNYTTKRYKMEYISSRSVIFVSGFDNFLACKDYINSIKESKPNFNQKGMLQAIWPLSAAHFNIIVKNRDADQFKNKILPSLLQAL